MHYIHYANLQLPSQSFQYQPRSASQVPLSASVSATATGAPSTGEWYLGSILAGSLPYPLLA